MGRHTTAEKIALYRSLFTGLPGVYGTYDLSTGKVRQVKAAVNDAVLLAHLQGKQSYGVYLLVGDTTRALAVDFDSDQLCYPLAFKAAAKRHDFPAYIERSKSKGYHVWMFFTAPGVSARKARLVARSILAHIDQLDTEIFPKQDVLDDRTTFGNFINAPLFGTLVPEGRTVFVDPANPTEPYPDQWELLGRIQRIKEVRLTGIIQSCGLDKQQTSDRAEESRDESCNRGSAAKSFGLPPCAQTMLAGGVTEQQRVSCFRLAVHLKRAGLPFDLAETTLRAWAGKNTPANGKRVITDREIHRQTTDAYVKPYHSCGCEDPAMMPFCDPQCPLYARSHGKRALPSISVQGENSP